MPDINELVETLKRAAIDAVEAKKPMKVCFGEVVSVSPLKIGVEQKMILGEKQLILSRNVTDFKTKITAGNTAVGDIEITVHNGLAVGEKVILFRQQEGQKFVVADRIG